jgi:hypothetical protein
MKSTDAGRATHVRLTHPLRPPPKPDLSPLAWTIRGRKGADGRSDRVKLRFVAISPPHRTLLTRFRRRLTGWFGRMHLALRAYFGPKLLLCVCFFHKIWPVIRA